MGIIARVGDVFLIPLKGGGCAGGQIVSAWNDELYVAVFGHRLDAFERDLSAVTSGMPIFLTLTLNAKLWHGDWPIIGSRKDNLRAFPPPAYKVRQAGVIHVESRDRTSSRPASPAEASELKHRTVSAPAVVEDAVAAYFSEGEWSAHYDDLRSDYAILSSRLL
jgi:hypothetical protein